MVLYDNPHVFSIFVYDAPFTIHLTHINHEFQMVFLSILNLIISSNSFELNVNVFGLPIYIYIFIYFQKHNININICIFDKHNTNIYIYSNKFKHIFFFK